MIVIAFLGFYSCKENPKKETVDEEIEEEMTIDESKPDIKLSLAQWSMHKMILEEGVDPYTFAEKASEWGFEGLEYVSALYYKELQAANFSEEAMNNWVEKSKAESEKYGLKNLLIMVDGQGDIAVADETKRKEAVENHYKWVDAAAALGCHSIRVNLNGSMDPEVWMPASVAGLTQLATYAKEKNINIIVENHGGPSSNAELLAEVKSALRDATDQDREIEVARRLEELKTQGLLIQQWDLDRIGADLSRCGLAGSPTKVFRVQSIVLTKEGFTEIPPTEEGARQLIQELIVDHSLG